jgi:hypothetical protein
VGARPYLIVLLLALPIGQPAAEQTPAGFAELTDVFWTQPWLVDQRGSPVSSLRHTMHPSSGEQIAIRLDDGRRGTLRVSAGSCATPAECEPFDCGCPLKDESYWVEIMDAEGVQIARQHLWAAYGDFDIMPVDLVDGPGDELIIVRVPGHSSPPAGHDLKIWQLRANKVIDLVGATAVAGLLESRPMGCARWRAQLIVDSAAPKPRALTQRAEFAMPFSSRTDAPACELTADGKERHTALSRSTAPSYRRGPGR